MPRSATVAVGFRDHTWREIEVEIAEDPNYVLDDLEVKEQVKEVARRRFSREEGVSFIKVLFIEPIDYMDGMF